MVIPSEITTVLNSSGVPPASRTPSLTHSASSRRWELQGVVSDPGVRDPDQRALEVLVGEPDGAEHRAGRRAVRPGDDGAAGEVGPPLRVRSCDGCLLGAATTGVRQP
jgi:hypothetical protein